MDLKSKACLTKVVTPLKRNCHRLVLQLHEFPEGYTRDETPWLGAVDEIGWMTADAEGKDRHAVPAGTLLHVTGWASDSSGHCPPSAVMLAINCGHYHEARQGRPRSDVAALLEQPGLSQSGFDALLCTTRLPIGTHQLSVFAVDAGTRRYARIANSEFTVVPSRFDLPVGITYGAAHCAAWVDEVIDVARTEQLHLVDRTLNAPDDTLLSLRGWAYDRAVNLPVGRLYAVLDGEHAFRANYGHSRPDVGEALRIPGLSQIGFAVRIPTIGLPFGAHRIELIGVDRSCDALLHGDLTIELVIDAHDKSNRLAP